MDINKLYKLAGKKPETVKVDGKETILISDVETRRLTKENHVKIIDIENNLEKSQKEFTKNIESSKQELTNVIKENVTKVDLSTAHKFLKDIFEVTKSIPEKINFSSIMLLLNKILSKFDNEPIKTEIKKRDGKAYEIVYTYKDRTVTSKINRSVSGTTITSEG